MHADWEEADRYGILVAAGEAIVNAVTHGSRPGGSVGVVFSVSSWLARVSVVDRGTSDGSLLRWPPECPGPEALHGRGLVMIESLSNRVEVGSCGQGTRISMEFDRRAVRALRAA